jgi:hypothetical protein
MIRWSFQLLFILSVTLYGKEYAIQVKQGWQLIGLPSDIDNMRVFSNSNVHLVWSYDAKYGDWLGFSPEKSTIDKLYASSVNILTNIERWHGVWVYSYNDWELNIEENIDLYEDSRDVSSLKIYKGWNLVSLPYETVLSSELFSNYKIWKYTETESWQTNQRYREPFNFPEIDELNTKGGFWLYSGITQTVDLSEISSEIDTVKTNDELISRVTQGLIVGERKDKYWGWEEQEAIYVVDEVEDETEEISNAITNDNEPPKEEINADIPKKVIEDGNYLYYLNEDRDEVRIQLLETVLFSSSSVPKSIPVNFKNSETNQSYNSTIESFYVTDNGDRLVTISKLLYKNQSPTFAENCRVDKIAVSIHDISEISYSSTVSKKHIFFDGELKDSRMIGNSLYLISNFKPCIELEYPKTYLDILDKCRYFEDTVEYYNECYDVENDDIGLFRYDYENPSVKNLYYMPKYLEGTAWNNLIEPDTLYSFPKLDQDHSFLTISHIDTATGTLSGSKSIFGEIGYMHVSPNSLYLAYSLEPHHLSFEEYKAREKIFKFNFYPVLEYRASGEIDGELINRFGIDEYDKVLRVGTRDKYSWKDSSYTNRIESFIEQNGELKRAGSISNFVNEVDTINGIKFFQDKALVSVYRETAPFYILNLKDKDDLRKGGSFEVQGSVENVLISHEDNRLITFGRGVTDTGNDYSVDMNYFDISDIERPQLIATKNIGDYYNYSSVFYNPNSVAYNNSVVSFPVGGGESAQSVTSGLYNFKITSLGIEDLNTLSVPTITRDEENDKTYLIETNNQLFSIFVNRGKVNRVKIVE